VRIDEIFTCENTGGGGFDGQMIAARCTRGTAVAPQCQTWNRSQRFNGVAIMISAIATVGTYRSERQQCILLSLLVSIIRVFPCKRCNFQNNYHRVKNNVYRPNPVEF